MTKPSQPLASQTVTVAATHAAIGGQHNTDSQQLNSGLNWALRYADLGWRVLPVKGKKPVIRNWPTAATTVPARIQNWFKSRRNIGVATGNGSGIVVIDVDPRNGGNLSLKQLEQQLGPLPKTATANTGGGGKHFIFQDFENSKSRVLRNGIDFLAAGKMFVATPSVHPDSDRPYSWQSSPWDTPPQQLPSAWRRELQKSTEPPRTDRPNPTLTTTPINQGQRNTTLTRLAGQLKARGDTYREIRTRLLEDNHTRCKPPLEFDEVISIVDSVASLPTSHQSLKTRWQEAVLASEMSTTTKLVLLSLSMFADQHGRSCYPTQVMLADRTSATSKTVSKHLKLAEQQGWINRYQHQRKGLGYNYAYVLTIGLRPAANR